MASDVPTGFRVRPLGGRHPPRPPSPRPHTAVLAGHLQAAAEWDEMQAAAAEWDEMQAAANRADAAHLQSSAEWDEMQAAANRADAAHLQSAAEFTEYKSASDYVTELVACAVSGDTDRALALVASGVDVNASCPRRGHTFLTRAVGADNLTMVQFALRPPLSADPNVRSAAMNCTPLDVALIGNLGPEEVRVKVAIIRVLHDAGATEIGTPDLDKIMASGSALIKMLIDYAYVDPNATIKMLHTKTYRRTLLSQATVYGDLDCVAYLLDHNADVDGLPVPPVSDSGAVIDIDADTPLAYAISAGHVPVFELLLARGANVNARTSKRHRPVLSACLASKFFFRERHCVRATTDCDHMARRLLDKGADPHAVYINQHGHRASLLATAARDPTKAGFMRMLLDSGATYRFDEFQPQVTNPMYAATRSGSAENVRVLLQHAARDWFDNRTPLPYNVGWLWALPGGPYDNQHGIATLDRIYNRLMFLQQTPPDALQMMRVERAERVVQRYRTDPHPLVVASEAGFAEDIRFLVHNGLVRAPQDRHHAKQLVRLRAPCGLPYLELMTLGWSRRRHKHACPKLRQLIRLIFTCNDVARNKRRVDKVTLPEEMMLLVFSFFGATLRA